MPLNSSNNSGEVTDLLIGLVVETALVGAKLVVGVYLINFMFRKLKVALGTGDGNDAQQQQFLKKLAERLGRPEVQNITFDKHEIQILTNVIGANEIDTTFADIGGLDAELEEVRDNVILPIVLWSKFQNAKSIASFPCGMLLYGNPGTGKSLTAKAIAREAGATFISIKASTLMDKYVGESDKLVTALFSVARKLSPSIIFIDEIDTMLSKRDSSSNSGHQGMASMQGVFFQEWDGLRADTNTTTSSSMQSQTQQPVAARSGGTTPTISLKQQQQQQRVQSLAAAAASGGGHAPVIVLGATNRPADLDKAFLRRLPVQIKIRDPTTRDRLSIFKAQLRREKLAQDVDLQMMAEATNGMTGSDIKEIIRVAALQRLKSVALVPHSSSSSSTTTSNASAAGAGPLTVSSTAMALASDALEDIRPLNREDFLVALTRRNNAVREVNKFSNDIFQQDVDESPAGRQARQQQEEVMALLAHLNNSSGSLKPKSQTKNSGDSSDSDEDNNADVKCDNTPL